MPSPSASSSLVPHAVCWAAAPRLIWTMVITNMITFLSYLSICATLFYLARRTRRVIARDWVYFLVGFALFIVACGSTHLLEVITTWDPIFWVDAATNVVTAALSSYVAFMLILRAREIAFGINDYAERLGNTENEKHQMQESLLAAQKVEEWSRMSAAVSHEIRNPLEAIQNLLYLITTSEGVPPEVNSLAQTAAEEASRVLTISESTLSFIRQTSRPEPVDFCSVLDSVRFLLTPLIREKCIQFSIEQSGECVAETFAGETRQVLLNVIRNACEAINQPGKRVSIKLTGEESGVEVIVSDQGTGIHPAMLANLFHFGKSTKGDHGNGMGLWTVKHILDKHRGDVKVHSTPGEGTCFTLWWPRTYSAAAPGQVVTQ